MGGARCRATLESLDRANLFVVALDDRHQPQQLYRDVWEQRPPGIYWTYLAGFSLFGWTSPAAVA